MLEFLIRALFIVSYSNENTFGFGYFKLQVKSPAQNFQPCSQMFSPACYVAVAAVKLLLTAGITPFAYLLCLPSLAQD